jgi:hypothetical protein
MDKKNVITVLVCHNTIIVNNILSNYEKINCHILFVGDESISDELSNNNRITVVRNLPNNIENEKDLLTFTAWYAIVKNDLFVDYNYICILEYDVHLEKNYELELNENCENNLLDCISFIHVNHSFDVDINKDVFANFMNKKELPFKILNEKGWYSTTNHCLKRKVLIDFVDWYYPDCLDIKKLDPIKFSWYHERLFASFMDAFSLNICHLKIITHYYCNSHVYMHLNS